MKSIKRLGRDSNNYVYHIQLKEVVGKLAPMSPTRQRPGTVSLSIDKTDVVIRISNPQALVNEQVRVQNEVAAMCLTRQALSSYG